MDLNLAGIVSRRGKQQRRAQAKPNPRPPVTADQHGLDDELPLGLNLCDVKSNRGSRKKKQVIPKIQKTKKSRTTTAESKRKPKSTKHKPERKQKIKKTPDQKEHDVATIFGTGLPRQDLQEVFKWNSKLFSMFESNQFSAENTQSCHYHLFGHYEFAGGGGAEVATAAICAGSSGSVTADAMTQADWDTGKLSALKLNMQNTCRFKNIMDVVQSAEHFEAGRVEHIEVSQREVLTSLGLERCRIDNQNRGMDSDSTFGEGSTTSSDSDSDSREGSGNESLSDTDLVPSTDESVVRDENNDFFVDEDDLKSRLEALFDKKNRLKRPIGQAEEGWKLLSSSADREIVDRLNLDSDP